MKRADKYKDTSYFHFYNANSHNHYSGDCVIRAICTALNQSWEETLTEMFKIGLKYGYEPTDYHVIDRYLKEKGWVKCKQPRNEDNTKMSIKKFIDKLYHPVYCEELPLPSNGIELGRIICNAGSHHIVAVVSGQVYDIWNSSNETCGNFWVKPY